MFGRTIRLMEHGIKPVYVFDGKAPTMKSGEVRVMDISWRLLFESFISPGRPRVANFRLFHHEMVWVVQLAKRKEAKAKAERDLKAVEERIQAAGEDDVEATKEAIAEADKLSKRTVRMDKSHQDEAKHLLRLMGVPVVEAPCEAEAQCAALAKAGVVWAAASEDMDTLCFGTPRLLRRLTFSEARKLPVWQIDLATVLEGTELTMEEFVDVCILCGCDYLEPLKGIGPKKALDRVRKHGSLAAVVEALRADSKFDVPDVYPTDEALRLFHEADVTDPAVIAPSIKWAAPDEAGLIEYLVDQKGFNVDRVRSAIERLKKARSKGSQKRMESFFTTSKTPKAAAKSKSKSKVAAKRKPAAAAASASASSSSAAAAAPSPAPAKPAPVFAAASKATKPRKARAAVAVVDSDDDDDEEEELEVPLAKPVAAASPSFSASSLPAASASSSVAPAASFSAVSQQRVAKRSAEDGSEDEAASKRDKAATE
jgi:flap endonuclease-1